MPVGVDERYFGYDEFVWFVGVVEDLSDPEQISRVRVRVVGHNPDSKETLPTEKLMWATVMMPTTSASVSGIGHSPHGLMTGSYVFGFYMDGKYCQQPVVMGSWHGVPQELADPSLGFNDPQGEFPREANEPDTNKLARGVNTIEDVIDSDINNPASPYAAVYPHNKVYETQSGHIIEVDDTATAERIRIRHTSGSFVEMHPNGDVVKHTANNGYAIVAGNDNVKVSGSVNVFIEQDANITVRQNAIIDVAQNVEQTIGGNVTQTVSGGVTQNVSGTTDITCPTTNITGNINLDGDIKISGTSTADGDHVSAGISGKGHKHTIAGGSSAGKTLIPE
jgi:hypothetical protein